MSCEDKDYQIMSDVELLQHMQFHYRQSQQAADTGDSYGWKVESQKSGIMYFRWMERLANQHGEQWFWRGPGRKNYDLGVYIAGLEAELIALEAFGGTE